jgi:phosphatidylethanolamine/phosphatidyl-N-methylethanolamine N-methyltransferase
MDNDNNLRIYRAWAPVYDLVMGPFSGRARQEAVKLLDLRPGEQLLIPGVGTGIDLPLIPPGISIVGVDISQEMLAKAHLRVDGRQVTLLEMDAQALDFADGSFDAVLFNLILSVVPDGAAAFREAWRVLRPGGRAVIFDKFLSANSELTPIRRLAGRIVSAFGTDPNRRASDIIGGVPGLTIERDQASLLGGLYRILRLCKS